jgi:REP element-mobilizing transposase RayT
MLTPPRKRLRLPSYDYRLAGWYFITVVTHLRRNLFGHVEGARLVSSAVGEIVKASWSDIPAHHPHVVTDAFVAMPNHAHGLLYFPEAVGSGEPRSAVDPGALGSVVRSFKASVTRNVRRSIPSHQGTIWQANYYEHIVRSLEGVEYVRWYIESNPERWSLDPENTARVGVDRADGWFEEQGAIVLRARD